MRLIHYYLIGYCLLVIGAALALWQAGVLTRIVPFWLFVSALIVVGLGLAVAHKITPHLARSLAALVVVTRQHVGE